MEKCTSCSTDIKSVYHYSKCPRFEDLTYIEQFRELFNNQPVPFQNLRLDLIKDPRPITLKDLRANREES